MSHQRRFTLRLFHAMSQLPQSVRQRHADWVRRQHQDCGGFPDRSGKADIYYTAFALRSLAGLGSIDETTSRRCERYLARCWGKLQRLVDWTSWLTAVSLSRLMGFDQQLPNEDEVGRAFREMLAPLQRQGGYAKTPESGFPSTYHTYLAVLCLEAIGDLRLDPQEVTGMLRARQQADGGMSELPMLRRGGTNPTAAAVGICDAMGLTEAIDTQRAASFLQSMQTPEGGFLAAAQAPMPDLLSSFTGLATLDMLGCPQRADLMRLKHFAESLENAAGGFLGTPGDDQADVEYTFYGLGTLGMIALLNEDARSP